MGPLTGNQLGNQLGNKKDNYGMPIKELGDFFQDIDPESGFMTSLPDMLGGLGEGLTGESLGYYNTQSVAQGQAHGQQRGGKIGKGIGAAVGMLGGPVGSAIGAAVGQLAGSIFGGGKAKNDAMQVVAQRQSKQSSTMDMYRELARDKKTNSDQEAAFFGSL